MVAHAARVHDRVMRWLLVAVTFVACSPSANTPAPDASAKDVPIAHLFADGVVYGEALDGRVFGGAHLDNEDPALFRAFSISGVTHAFDFFPPPEDSVCAAMSTGEILCEGSNVDGNLGSIATQSCGGDSCANEPDDAGCDLFSCCYPCVTTWTVLPDARDLRQIHRNCGIDANGNLVCWGKRYGVPFPRPIAKLAGVFAILDNADLYSVAGEHLVLSNVTNAATDETRTQSSCAVTSDTILHCWGTNQLGEVGDGTTIARADPVTIASGFREVVMSASRTCAIRVDDTIMCWGAITTGGALSPTAVDGVTDVKELAIDVDGIVYALRHDGTVVAIFDPSGKGPTTIHSW